MENDNNVQDLFKKEDTDVKDVDLFNERDEETKRKKKKNIIKEIMEYVLIIVFALLATRLIKDYVFVPVVVDGQSMETTLLHDDKLIVWEFNYHPKRFDVIVFDASEYSPTTTLDSPYYIKRIIGIPGDHVEFKNDKLFINGEYIEEPFLDKTTNHPASCSTFTCDFTLESISDYSEIPEGYYLVLGDNRPNSQDSEEFGLIKEEDILGKAVFRVLPFKTFGKIE